MLAINVESVTWMTRLVLPSMLAKKRGAVVNMSSASARAPLPLLAQYSATKGYVENFTRSLAVVRQLWLEPSTSRAAHPAAHASELGPIVKQRLACYVMLLCMHHVCTISAPSLLHF